MHSDTIHKENFCQPKGKPFFLAILLITAAFFHQDADLRVTIDAKPREWMVNEAGILELTVKVQEGRFQPGDRIGIHIPPGWMLHGFRLDEREGRVMGNQPYSVLTQEVLGCFSVASPASGAQWKLDLVEHYRDGTYHRFARELQLELISGSLQSGEELTIRYGSKARPIHASVLAEKADFLFRLARRNEWREAGGVSVTTLPEEAKRLLLTGASVGRTGESLRYHVTARDSLGNATRLPAHLEARAGEGLLVSEFKSKEAPFQEFQVQFPKPGVHRIEIGNEKIGYARSNPIVITEEEPRLRLYWGDLHSHSEISKDGIGLKSFEFARDYSNLDFFASTEHSSGDRNDVGITDQEWEEIQSAVREYYRPGRFVTLLGYEASFPHPYGHHNVFFDSDAAPLHRDNEVRTLDELWDLLASRRAFTVPHHTGIRFGGVSGTGASAVWERDHRLRPLIEIYSGHGQSERFAPDDHLSYDQIPFFQRWKNWFPRHAPDTPDEYRTVWGPTSVEGPHYARDAWAAGLTMSTVAASDDHTARPGQASKGLAAVWAPALDRESIFGSLLEKRTYGTTGQRIYLDFRVNGVLPGSRIRAGGAPSIFLEVHGTDDLEWVELVKLDQRAREYQVLQRWTPKRLSFTANLADRSFSAPSFYYLRVKQSGLVEGRPAMAWSSPIWVSAE
ncbi:MAG: DUF3604 domain-containing protein [Acidobacteriota bacterium]